MAKDTEMTDNQPPAMMVLDSIPIFKSVEPTTSHSTPLSSLTHSNATSRGSSTGPSSVSPSNQCTSNQVPGSNSTFPTGPTVSQPVPGTAKRRKLTSAEQEVKAFEVRYTRHQFLARQLTDSYMQKAEKERAKQIAAALKQEEKRIKEESKAQKELEKEEARQKREAEKVEKQRQKDEERRVKEEEKRAKDEEKAKREEEIAKKERVGRSDLPTKLPFSLIHVTGSEEVELLCHSGQICASTGSSPAHLEDWHLASAQHEFWLAGKAHLE